MAKPDAKLFVGGLPSDFATEEFIFELFAGIGPRPSKVVLIPSRAEGTTRTRDAYVYVPDDVKDFFAEALDGIAACDDKQGLLDVRVIDDQVEATVGSTRLAGLARPRTNGPPSDGVDGNWKCPGCSNVNFAIRVACNRCHLPKPHNPGGSRGKGEDTIGAKENWTCLQCSNLNFPGRDRCNRCQAERDAVEASSPAFVARTPAENRGKAPIEGENGNWRCVQCNNVNFAMRDICHRCHGMRSVVEAAPSSHAAQVPDENRGRAPVAGENGNWRCLQCSNVNFAVRDRCNRCQAERSAESQQLLPSVSPFDEIDAAEASPSARGSQFHAGSRGKAPVEGENGNWKCVQCSNVNFAVRDRCNRCQADRVAQEAPLRSTVSHTIADSRGKAPVEGENGNWRCLQCKNVNFTVRDRCNRCQTERCIFETPPPPPPLHPLGESRGRAPVEGENGNWKCSQCRNVNFGVRDRCNRCQAERPSFESLMPAVAQQIVENRRGPPVEGENGNWRCLQCSNVNFAVRDRCNRCQGERSAVEASSESMVAHTLAESCGRTPVEGENGNWKCPLCENVNSAVSNHCSLCLFQESTAEPATSLPARRQAGKAPVDGLDGNWKCFQCGNVNYAVREQCNRCQSEKSLACQSPPASIEVSHLSGSQGAAEGRQGDWTCSVCQNVNFASRDRCNRCKAERMSAEKVSPSVSVLPSAAGRGKAPVEGENGNWKCQTCRNINFGVREQCNRCYAGRWPEVVFPPVVNTQPVPVPSRAPVAGGFLESGIVHSASGEHRASATRRGPPVEGVDGNWRCETCANINFAVRDRCNMCKIPRPHQGKEVVEFGKGHWDTCSSHPTELRSHAHYQDYNEASQPMQKRARM
eukprot:TRINITY_DN2363_c3_g1_i1.p1 TRINITY_DN2363_c3_g1~~TRINITY_DN2363_c3_g1_i1.p1  ORF type:complete len:867 (-),score=101.28 TRINITY_DN2363_c3_g1_i1:100-2700(-)